MGREEIAVIGGGLVGAAIAFGLARARHSVTLLDEGDVAFRAARGNFGNVWVQGKGAGCPPYADLSRSAARDWDSFAADVEDVTGIDLQFHRRGAFFVCLDAEELQRRAETLRKLEAEAHVPAGFELADNAAIRKEITEIGPRVPGATFCAADGAANPLRLLRALIAGTGRLGGIYRPQSRVESVKADGDGFAIETAGGRVEASRVVLAAGLGNAHLAPMLGLAAPVRPVRGQVLVTEKLKPFMKRGIQFIRQTEEGGLIIGDSSEEAGLDEGTTRTVLGATARRAITVLPFLEHVRIVRTWGALRVMSPDGLPIYQQSRAHPGAFLVSVHSGVTLAPAHAGTVAAGIGAGALPASLTTPFSPDRFDVRDDRAA